MEGGWGGYDPPMTGVERCQEESRRAAAEVLAGDYRMGGPRLGISDWIWEEMEIMSEGTLEAVVNGNSQTEGIDSWKQRLLPLEMGGKKYDWIEEQHLSFGQSLVRTFDSGANRSSDDGKPDFEGFLSPLVLERYGEYMHKHRQLPDGNLRSSDNWQKGIPQDAYIKSGWRHFMDWWGGHRGLKGLREPLEDSLCALLFNVTGYLHEVLKQRGYRQ